VQVDAVDGGQGPVPAGEAHGEAADLQRRH
jgi:hypothetical protein